MRMWNVPTRWLCDKHLLGQHVELHMILGSMKKKKNLGKLLTNGCVSLTSVNFFHLMTVIEMQRRDMKHNSPMDLCETSAALHEYCKSFPYANIDQELPSLKDSLNLLFGRCLKCRLTKELDDYDYNEECDKTIQNVKMYTGILRSKNGK